MNPKPPSDLAKRLVAQQRVNDVLQQKYKQEINKMFEEKLSQRRKAFYILRIVLCGVAISFFGYQLRMDWGGPRHVLVLDISAVLGIGVYVTNLVRVFLRGILDRRAQDRFTVQFQVAVIVILAIVTYLTAACAPDPISGVRMLASGAIFLALLVMSHIKVLIRESRMQLEERHLELQYRIAELAEKIEKLD